MCLVRCVRVVRITRYITNIPILTMIESDVQNQMRWSCLFMKFQNDFFIATKISVSKNNIYWWLFFVTQFAPGNVEKGNCKKKLKYELFLQFPRELKWRIHVWMDIFFWFLGNFNVGSGYKWMGFFNSLGNSNVKSGYKWIFFFNFLGNWNVKLGYKWTFFVLFPRKLKCRNWGVIGHFFFSLGNWTKKLEKWPFWTFFFLNSLINWNVELGYEWIFFQFPRELNTKW